MKLLIAGAGGHGRVVAEAALLSARFSEVAFVDDRFPNIVLAEGWPVVGDLSALHRLRTEYDYISAAFGDAKLRLSVLTKARELLFECPTIIHPSAEVSPRATLGSGTAVIAGAVVNIGARLGAGCIVNTGATIDHDCVLSDGVHVGPGAHLAANVELGLRVWFGIGAVAKQGVRIGDDAVIGAGSVVIKDIPARVTVVGNPASELIHA